MTMKLPNLITIAALATGALLGTSYAASAQGDLYFMHNASPYYLWWDRESCERALARSGNSCVSTFNTSMSCGHNLFSTEAVRDVAAYKVNRNDEFTLRLPNTNDVFCTITP